MSYNTRYLFFAASILLAGGVAQAQISPTGITLGPSQQQQFSVPGQSAVTWAVNPPGLGTISRTGVYTAPASYYPNYPVIYVYASTGSTYYDTLVHLSPTAVSLPSSTAAPPVSVSVSISPSSAYLYSGQSRQFTAMVQGTANQQVSWSVIQGGGQISNGLYTAPSNVSSDTLVTISATSQADPTKSASATIQLGPAPAPTPAPAPASTSVSISLTPSQVSLQAGQSQRFSATVSGTTNTAVTWSLSPNVGSVGNGLYQAPASIPAAQAVTLYATSAQDTSKVASAIISLTPSPAPATSGTSVVPATITLSPSQLVGFTVQNPPAGANVAWSISPQIGNIGYYGYYRAPGTITTRQVIQVTATNRVTQQTLGTATMILAPPGAPSPSPTPAPTPTPTPAPTPAQTSVSPTTATISPSGTQTFTVQNLTSGTNVAWSVSPATGTITSAGVYTAPSNVSADTTVTVTASNPSTGSVLGTAVMTVKASPHSTTSTTITLPIEVMGANGTTQSVSFSIPQGSNVTQSLQLYAQIHGLKYETEASVQINSSAWLPINTANVTLLGLAANYGGIGGGFHTLSLTMNLPAGVVVAGTNTITFRFNQTDGVTSGYRVLAFNIQPVGGTGLIPSSTFVQDDPNTWQPPSTAASDISAGQTLWHTAALSSPGVGAIQAHCSDCHSEDGRDLKYFNYSNNSIIVRSEFHGLTAAQGAQIASYIRSLNVPNPGRPWNPPYQPGPGLDSQPVANWSAGAGLGAVLDSDSEMQQFMLPGGSDATWASTSYLNVRELPIPLQLPDWNSWLPRIAPIDAFGTTFTSSQDEAVYQTLRATLQPNNAASYSTVVGSGDFATWFVAEANIEVPIQTTASNSGWTSTLATNAYSLAQWQMVKQWELNQEFGLEAMPQAAFGSKADVRGWFGNQAFVTSPIILHIPTGFLGNGGVPVEHYLGYIWYHLQLILNDGQGHAIGSNPIDWGYVIGAVKDLSMNSGNTPAAFLQTIWLVKSLQEFTLDGIGPQVPLSEGFQPAAVTPISLVNSGWGSDFSGISPSLRTTISTDVVQQWFAQIRSFTPQQYDQGTDGSGRPWASPTENPVTDDSVTIFGGQVWSMLPRLRFLGVDPNLTYQISAWAATVWPAGNWALNNAATCISLGTCTSDNP